MTWIYSTYSHRLQKTLGTDCMYVCMYVCTYVCHPPYLSLVLFFLSIIYFMSSPTTVYAHLVYINNCIFIVIVGIRQNMLRVVIVLMLLFSLPFSRFISDVYLYNYYHHFILMEGLIFTVRTSMFCNFHFLILAPNISIIFFFQE